MDIIRRAVLCIAFLVLPRQKEAEDLAAEEADDEADQDTREAAVVPGGVGSIEPWLVRCFLEDTLITWGMGEEALTHQT